jgi:hypothetical protein
MKKKTGRPMMFSPGGWVIFSMRVSKAQREAIKTLGGAVWLRDVINREMVKREKST